MSNRWPSWVGDSLEPSDSEVQKLGAFGTERLRDAVIDATEPTDAEMATLLARRPWTAPGTSRRPVWVGGGLALAAAAAVALVVALPEGEAPVAYGEVAIAVNAPTALSAMAVTLGPSIAMSGDATVVLEQANERGTELSLTEGRAHFDVDPNGLWRDLAVDADGVIVRVHGTVFDVVREGDAVSVEVERGRVSVTWDGEEVFVTTGESWQRPMPEVAVWTPEPVEGVADAEPLVPVEPPPVAVARPVAEPVPVVAPPADEGIADDPEPEEETVTARISEGSADHELAQILALQASGLAPAALLEETDAVLERHRGSGVSAEIELVRLQTLARVDPSLAAVEMGDWLDAHPGASRAPLIRFERARVSHRSLGRCASALRDYTTVAERSDELGVRATAGAGLCALELGHDTIAKRHLTEAVERGITGALASEVRAALVTIGE